LGFRNGIHLIHAMTCSKLRLLLWLGTLSLDFAFPLLSAPETPPTYAQAEALVRAGQIDQSIALINQILAVDPKHVKARNLMGIALSSKGDLSGANREYRKALEIDPKFYHALKNLAINELAQKNVIEAK